MKGRFGRLVMTLVHAAGAATVACHAAAERTGDPSAPTSSEVRDLRLPRAQVQGGDARTFMEHDIAAQLAWLAQQARDHGYTDLQDLLVNAPHVYARLAVVWRQLHPVPMAA